MKALNFTDFCKQVETIEKVKKALEFYNSKFTVEKIFQYFKNWKIEQNEENSHIIIIKNIHSNGKWSTTVTINDNAEYTFADNNNCWQYVPNTMSEFISDILRYEDFELIFKDEVIEEIFGENKNESV